ncbi:hypothetical protein [Streptomyces sp. NPDC089799]|uniref:hypothetical protein n=1 Tax=Streptomyces sp. NPDC089799 TaxID=3155066 RepID=UPI00342D0B22
MHSPAEPALPHNDARPLHWLATAAAMAAVIAGAGFLQPAAEAGTLSAPAGPAAPGTPRTAPRVAAPDAALAQYPLDCRGGPHQVTATAHGDLDGDGRPETVAAVRCDAGLGTPPNALYVLTQDTAAGTPPRVVATLLPAAQRKNVTELAVSDGKITATLLGYSGPDVPRCCPDTRQHAKWAWTGGKFSHELTDAAALHA